MNISEKQKKILVGIFIGLGCVIIAAIMLGGGYAYWITNQANIHPNVYIQGVNVGGMLPDEATLRLENEMKNKLDEKELTLMLGDKSWSYPLESIGYNYDYDKAINKAWNLGRYGNIIQNAMKVRRLQERPYYIELENCFEKDLIDKVLDELENELNFEGKAATLERASGEFVIIAEIEGKKLRKEESRETIIDALEDGALSPLEISVDTISVYPTKADLKLIDGVIGEFSTRFNAGVVGRTANLKLGAQSIDGTLLLPDEEFSFNKATGPRSAAAGYREAPVIVQGELVPGIGGGICQVSTTLYNAAIRSNLPIVERRNHSLPVSYVNLGHDATVSYGAIDLKFKNHYDYPIYIESYIQGNRIFVNVYGNESSKIQRIDLASHVTEVIEAPIEEKQDEELYEGEIIVEQEPKRGYRVVTYKIYYENGREIKREEISRDYYRPVKGIKLVGVKPRPLHEQFEQHELIEYIHSQYQSESEIEM
ncbi:VanW family protein [Tindallia californiensis]|uniref:Vancomycin resistance protein YoaR, contains peptidoglycan-binding and VanW domains n=1 Tax=Tindallia californiensis TaxID=159292 RepID=A0A1H3IAA2_9FIRM|nr:VanW family protein [Tindallia californiensis]SDY24581.1 Vancomycin resistance protein YoaR, contains peptidoglycan-binding and VanW domains [Tindallia californiensis]